MKKLLLLSIVALFLNGCRYIKTEEPYLDAKTSTELKIPEGVDQPNTSSTLEVPKAGLQKDISEKPDTLPPDMPIRTKQSDSGGIRIENLAGFPVLTVQTDKDAMWQAMNSIELDNWSVASADEDSCILILKYNDQAARERENANFIKKLFTRDKYYSDYSGEYKLSCQQQGSITKAKFAKIDDSAAKTFLADNVMTKLYGQFE